MTLRDQLQAAVGASDPVLYYDILARSGVAYASLAKGVVTADTYGGYIARAYANSVGQSVGKTVSPQEWFDLSVSLMNGDYQARFTGEVQNQLGWAEIQDYHMDAFDAIGLPAHAWTAFTPLAHSPNPVQLWDVMINSGSFAGNLQSTMLTMLEAITSLGIDDIDDLMAQIAGGNITLSALEQVLQEDLDVASWIYHGVIAASSWATPGNTGLGAVSAFNYVGAGGVHHIGGSDSSDDTLTGTSAEDLILGYKGNDIASSGAGDDSLRW